MIEKRVKIRKKNGTKLSEEVQLSGKKQQKLIRP